MVALKRAFTMAVAAALIVTLFPSVVPLASADAPLWTIAGPGAAAAVGQLGGKVQDDYGAFVTAHMVSDVAGTLRATGYAVAPVGATTGRGSYHFEPAVGDGIVPGAWRSDGSAYSIVAFRGPVKQSWRDNLLAKADIYDYLPSNAFLVKGDRASLHALEAVAFVGSYHAAYKLAPGLSAAEGWVHLTVLLFPDEDQAAAVQAVQATGATVRDTGFVEGLEGILKVETTAANLPALARLEAVSWIEPSLEGASPDNELATAIVQSGDPNTRSINDQGLDGSSQVLSVCDEGVETVGSGGVKSMRHEMYDDPAHPSVTYQQINPDHRKVRLYYSPVEHGVTKGDFVGGSHGTHTAGTVAGNIPPYDAYDSHDSGAYAAKLAICSLSASFAVPNDYATMWDPAYAAGARVNSNSWGSPHTNAYTDLARQHDAYAWTHRDFTVLRSAGNTGPNGLIRPEGIAKDVLTVASSRNAVGGAQTPITPEDLSAFSSRGPSLDGRIKPDITAPGECLNSALFGTTNGYTCISGTSMATPTAAAAAGLVRDYFAKGFYPAGSAGSGPALSPSNALVRAMLFASGYEMIGASSHYFYSPQLYNSAPAVFAAGGPLWNVHQSTLGRVPGVSAAGSFPNGNIGWGRIMLDRVLTFEGGARQLAVVDEATGLATGATQSFTFDVASSAEPLRVMLVWTDQPGAAGANPALVNDLDLSVSAGGLSFPGNSYAGSVSIPSGDHDRINNAEGVALPVGLAGTITVTVTGANVPNGPQPFAIVVAGSL